MRIGGKETKGLSDLETQGLSDRGRRMLLPALSSSLSLLFVNGLGKKGLGDLETQGLSDEGMEPFVFGNRRPLLANLS